MTRNAKTELAYCWSDLSIASLISQLASSGGLPLIVLQWPNCSFFTMLVARKFESGALPMDSVGSLPAAAVGLKSPLADTSIARNRSVCWCRNNTFVVLSLAKLSALVPKAVLLCAKDRANLCQRPRNATRNSQTQLAWLWWSLNECGRATFLHGRKPGKKASFPMKTPFES